MTASAEFHSETPLGVLDGNQPNRRTLVVLICDPEQNSWLELREQDWAGTSLGWFTNSTVRLDVAQLGQLRAMLAHTGSASRVQRRPESVPGGFTPRIIRAESA